jgi:uncharacterized tellurite resistance protein B-like protein
MRTYPNNSPEALARLLTALMASDDRIEDAQVESLGTLDTYSRLGITPTAFADVLRDYFADLKAADHGPSIDPSMDRAVIDCITDDDARMVAWELMVALAHADDELAEAESDFLDRVAQRWWHGQLPQRASPLPRAGAAASPGTRPGARGAGAHAVAGAG